MEEEMIKINSFIARLAFNSLAAFGLFFLFTSLGWISIPGGMPLWAVAIIVTIASVIVGWIIALTLLLLSPIILLAGCLSLGLGFLMLGPVFQYFGLLLISEVTQIFDITSVWWQALIIGALFNWIRAVAPSSD